MEFTWNNFPNQNPTNKNVSPSKTIKHAACVCAHNIFILHILRKTAA